jgi:hypothetical protein
VTGVEAPGRVGDHPDGAHSHTRGCLSAGKYQKLSWGFLRDHDLTAYDEPQQAVYLRPFFGRSSARMVTSRSMTPFSFHDRSVT